MEPTPLAIAAREIARTIRREAPRVPVATYRLQFNRDFTFQNARAVLEYLDALGITDVYASPYLKAQPDSMHGYDICDHAALNPAIGDESDYAEFTAELARRGMGQVLDVVPNHMGIGGAANRWWMDVLESGQSSIYAPYFDIDWTPLKAELTGKVLLPVLGEQYGRALESRSLPLRYADGGFHVEYYDRLFPISPTTSAEILRLCLGSLADYGLPDRRIAELSDIVATLSRLPSSREINHEWARHLHAEKAVVRRRLLVLHDSWPELRDAIQTTLRLFAGAPGDPRSFDRLDALLEAQAYRLSFWRVASEEINYRRFFDVNDLAAIRVESERVFAETHEFIVGLLASGRASGLRIDHPDGLWDPLTYLRRLQRAYLRERVVTALAALADESGPASEARDMAALRLIADEACREIDAEPEPGSGPPLYVVAEKILHEGERLGDDWPVHGTTGYDFANAVNGLFVDSRSERAFDDLYSWFIGRRTSFADVAYQSRKLIMRTALASEINVLGHRLNHLSEKDRHSRDFTLNSLTDALREIIACLPVYRTYVTGVPPIAVSDRAAINSAVTAAKRRNPASDPTIFDFIREVLLLERRCGHTNADWIEQRDFVMKFQQCTGPVAAKGVEDTAFYTYNRLVSLNEVGGNPARYGLSVGAFHDQMAERGRRWPHSLLATTTHDTKRGEDVRARIDALSEMPREWRARLARWTRLNARFRATVDGEPAPDRNDEYLIYQTLLGAWPFERMEAPSTPPDFVARVETYVLKAIREAKAHTSWINPNAEYESATVSFLRSIVDSSRRNPFLADFAETRRRVAEAGVYSSLAQTLVKLTAPGVPDFYQGSELWELRLVDPDNRGPVDYPLRAKILAEMADLESRDGRLALARRLVADRADGRIKLYLIQRTLRFRRENADLFRVGEYVPLATTGAAREHVVGFARVLHDRTIIAVAPRLIVGLTRGQSGPPIGEAVWTDTRLALPFGPAASAFRNVLTDEVVPVRWVDGEPTLALDSVMANFPVALLEGCL